ncbi:PDDEXK nuclease domain-containing protein [Prosthecobacter sp.]|uniref:PDDEXK nuclease domain-containing protein n=1 Tax=Prosthecobacter sp. TaxID=1965333 RepID=UPI002ABAA148|nr:PDDEXK nuclease domain-containing protein [Prosthecobacter sp.]MDZ4405441.1 PDDEXK nuclease domain-containing protein [Prosthecobacter sp.]
MKKPSVSKKAITPAKTKPDGLTSLLTEVRQLIQSARRGVSTVVDTFQVMTNFEIGRRIVEHEQNGAKRAAYGAELLKELSARLTEEFGRGFSAVNLSQMRRFFLVWQDRAQIFQTASEKLGGTGILQTLSEKSASSEIPQTASGKLIPTSIRQTPSGKSPFTLSWSHYVVLMTIKDPDERSFYEIESRQADWDVRELKRQKASCLYERLALSRDKEGIRKLAKEGQVIVRPEDLLKEPLVLEFLGLDAQTSYSETDLEQAIINRLEHFLLELGKGFLFEARQKRFTFDEDHYFVDLVFYNRLLRCYVIIDLKLDKLTHQDLGQMQMYVNYYDREVKLPEENPTIGLLLCKSAKKTVVELTLPKDANIHAKEYQLYLPSKELLKQKLDEWSAAASR